MTTKLLPDRERRHLLQFYFVPKLGYLTRWVIGGGLIAAGLAIQALSPGAESLRVIAVGGVIMLLGNLLLLARGYDTTPADLDETGEWEKTTRDRFFATRDMERKMHAAGMRPLRTITCFTGFLLSPDTRSAWAAIRVHFHAREPIGSTSAWAPVFAMDAIVLILPHWYTGTRRGWRPIALRQQIDALEPVLEVLDGYKEPPCQSPMSIRDERQGDQRTPTAARVFVRFPEGPQDFLGVQFQVTLNDVQGSKYPYLYAIVVAKKKLNLEKGPLKKFRKKIKSPLMVESGEESDVNVLVIRQETTADSGYHTKPAVIRQLADSTWRCVTEFLLEGSPRA